MALSQAVLNLLKALKEKLSFIVSSTSLSTIVSSLDQRLRAPHFLLHRIHEDGSCNKKLLNLGSDVDVICVAVKMP